MRQSPVDQGKFCSNPFFHAKKSRLYARSTNQELREKWRDSSLDVSELRRILDHDNHAMRDQLRDLLQSDPVFIR